MKTIDDHADCPAFRAELKRRRGFPSEPRVKRGCASWAAVKRAGRKAGRNTRAPRIGEEVSKKCCMHSGRFDGGERDDYCGEEGGRFGVYCRR